MKKKVWLVLLAVVLVLGLALLGCGSKGGGDDDDGDEDVVFNLPESIELTENPYGDGYQFMIDGACPSGKFTKGEEWELEIAFTVSRNVPVGIQIGLVDRDGGWDTLTWGNATVPDPFTTEALTKDTPNDFTGEKIIKLKVLKNAGGKSAKNNSIMFQTEGEFTPGNTGTVSNPAGAPGPITITFTKGTLTKKAATGGEDGGGEEEVYEQGVAGSDFDTTVGKKENIAVQSKGAFADGVIDFTDTTGSALFTLELPSATSATGTRSIKIKYICQVTTGTPDITLKNGGWGDIETANGTDGCNWYPTLTKDAVADLVLKEAWYADETEKISFQRNGDTNAFKLKIISVVME